MITHLVNTSGYGVQEHTPEKVRKALEVVEGFMRQQPQVTIEPTHVFSKGVYARQILIPKGCILTGKVHKQDDLQIMIYGDIIVKTEMGEKRLTGFNMFPSKAGYKQIGRALEDTLWVTVHGTDETDLDLLETQLFEDEPKVLDFKTGEPIEACIDYYRMLDEVGVTHETAWAQSCDETDRLDVEIPDIFLFNSCIHGTGVFASRGFGKGELVGPARVDGMRTQLGRFTNHHPTPNCEMRWGDINDIGLYTLRTIEPGEELLIDYRQSIMLVRGGIR